MKKNSPGFTLVEMLIVTSMLAIVSLSIYAIFNNGLNIWQRVNKPMIEEDLNIFFDKFGLELRNSFKFTGLTFSGTAYSIKFPTLVNNEGLNAKTVGEIEYFYDSNQEAINKEEKDFSRIYVGQRGNVTKAAGNIKSLQFLYYAYNEETKEYFWQGEWTKNTAPLAVRLELEFDDGAEIRKFIKTVTIPAAS